VLQISFFTSNVEPGAAAAAAEGRYRRSSWRRRSGQAHDARGYQYVHADGMEGMRAWLARSSRDECAPLNVEVSEDVVRRDGHSDVRRVEPHRSTATADAISWASPTTPHQLEHVQNGTSGVETRGVSPPQHYSIEARCSPTHHPRWMILNRPTAILEGKMACLLWWLGHRNQCVT
jgi:hypothetical protein